MADNTKDAAGSDQKGVEIHDLDHELTLDEMSYKSGGLMKIDGESKDDKHKAEIDIMPVVPQPPLGIKTV